MPALLPLKMPTRCHYLGMRGRGRVNKKKKIKKKQTGRRGREGKEGGGGGGG